MCLKIATLKSEVFHYVNFIIFQQKSKNMLIFFNLCFPREKKQSFFQNFRCFLEIVSGDSPRGGVLWFQSGTTVVPGNGLGLWKEVPWMQHAAEHG